MRREAAEMLTPQSLRSHSSARGRARGSPSTQVGRPGGEAGEPGLHSYDCGTPPSSRCSWKEEEASPANLMVMKCALALAGGLLAVRGGARPLHGGAVQRVEEHTSDIGAAAP